MSTADTIIALYSTKKSGPRKNPRFYRQVVSLFISDRSKFDLIINTFIPEHEYYKDYFWLMEAAIDSPEKDNIHDYMYTKIISLMRQWPKEKHLILSKWMPREKSRFDRSLDFIRNICKRLYPKDRLNIQRSKYRKLVSATSSKLNILESNLCQKSYDNITTLTENNLKTYQKAFSKNPDLRRRVETILQEKYQKFSLVKLLKEYRAEPMRQLRRQILAPILEDRLRRPSYPIDTMMILNIDPLVFNRCRLLLYSRVIKYLSNHDSYMVNDNPPRIVFKEPGSDVQQIMNLIDANIGHSKTAPTVDESTVVISRNSFKIHPRKTPLVSLRKYFEEKKERRNWKKSFWMVVLLSLFWLLSFEIIFD